MTRLIAIAAAVVLLVGVPGAYAATHASTLSGSTTHHTRTPVHHPLHHRPARTPVWRARHAALKTYFAARRMAHLLGDRVGYPHSIMRARSARWLHFLQRRWVRAIHGYQRAWHKVLLARHATRIAVSQVGRPYVYGAASPYVGFDCSGLVMWAYGRVGIRLPHSSYGQVALGHAVPRGHMHRGDLVFEYGNGHVGIYLGDGMVLAAPHTGTVVQRQPIGGWQIDAVRRVS